MLVSENQCEHGMIRYGSHGIKHELLANSFDDRYRLSYINALDHFVSAVQGSPTIFYDVMRLTKVIVIHRSSRSQKAALGKGSRCPRIMPDCRGL